jgi:hypothetical protein
MAELVGKARERILVILVKLIDVEIGGLARAGQPDTNEAGLVVSEHHPVMHPRALCLALRATGAAADAVAVHSDRPAESGAAREALPEPLSTGEPFPPAVPGESHRQPDMARVVPARLRLAAAMANRRLLASLVGVRP